MILFTLYDRLNKSAMPAVKLIFKKLLKIGIIKEALKTEDKVLGTLCFQGFPRFHEASENHKKL
jgi:hypothetical protein